MRMGRAHRPAAGGRSPGRLLRPAGHRSVPPGRWLPTGRWDRTPWAGSAGRRVRRHGAAWWAIRRRSAPRWIRGTGGRSAPGWMRGIGGSGAARGPWWAIRRRRAPGSLRGVGGSGAARWAWWAIRRSPARRAWWAIRRRSPVRRMRRTGGRGGSAGTPGIPRPCGSPVRSRPACGSAGLAPARLTCALARSIFVHAPPFCNNRAAPRPFRPFSIPFYHKRPQIVRHWTGIHA
jgi:hypothetical protein